MRIGSFAVVVGIVLVLVGLLVGADRFSASADGIKAQCTSVFDAGKGRSIVSYDNGSGTGQGLFPPLAPLVNACDSKRNQMRLFTWLLVGAGVVLTAGGVLIRKAAAK